MKKLRNWFIGDVLAKTEDVFVRAKIELLYSFTTLFCVLGLTFYLYLFLNDFHYHFYLISVAVITLGSVPFILKFSGSLKLASNWFIIQQALISVISAFIQRGAPAMNGGLWLMVAILFAFFLYNRLGGIIITFIFLVLGSLPSVFKDFYFVPEKEHLPDTAVVFLMPLILNIFVVWKYIKTREDAQKKINDQKDELEARNKEVLDSIHYAKRIQNSLMTNEKYIDRVLNLLKKKT
ncbi:MAG: hypothetical protein IAF38_22075 [Bacteroidia bacterium]|nr:hypothetical protein [Bacteroidia bacterium]